MDRHIQRLDADLLKHEEALSLGLRAGTMPSTDAQEAQNQAKIDAQAMNGQEPGTTAIGAKGDLAPPNAEKQRSTSTEAARKHKKKGGEKKKAKKSGITIGRPAEQLLVLPPGFVPPPNEVSLMLFNSTLWLSTYCASAHILLLPSNLAWRYGRMRQR